MARTFDRMFPELPPELRCKIFNFAVAPERPLVHFFGLYVPGEPCLMAPDPGLAPAQTQPSRGANETKPTACYHDEGLWGASRESRAVIWRRYHAAMSQHPAIDFLQNMYPDPTGGGGVSRTPRWYNHLLYGPLRREGEDINRTLTAIPKTHLICFRIADGDNVGVLFDPWWWQDQGDAQRLPSGLRGPHNIAFEYDASSWEFDIGKADMARMIAEAKGARGAFLCLVHELSRSLPYEADGDGKPFLPRIFLIDRAIRRMNANWMGHVHEWEFHGVGGERYVDVAAEAVEDGEEGMVMDALGFLDAISTSENEWVADLGDGVSKVINWHDYVTVLTCCDAQS